MATTDTKRNRPLSCSSPELNGSNPACRIHGTFEISITTANNLIAEWGLIIMSIARQCKLQPNGESCPGIAICRPHLIHPIFEIDITAANDLIAERSNLAASIAQQCKWRPQGQCLKDCQGIAVCNLDGLILVDHQGRPVAKAQTTPPPILQEAG